MTKTPTSSIRVNPPAGKVHMNMGAIVGVGPDAVVDVLAVLPEIKSSMRWRT